MYLFSDENSGKLESGTAVNKGIFLKVFNGVGIFLPGSVQNLMIMPVGPLKSIIETYNDELSYVDISRTS